MAPLPAGFEIPTSIPPTFRYPLTLLTATTFTTYVLSLVTGNVSQVDRIWTFMPTLYTAYWALLPAWPYTKHGWIWLAPYTPKDVRWATVNDFSPRAILMLALVTLWMCRLSYNTHRRGLFRFDEEDYRWAILRKDIPTWLFQVFNLGFVAITQNVLLFMLGLPTLRASLQPHSPLFTSDYVLAGLALITLAVEFTADNQQYAFQTWKHSGMTHDLSKEWPGANHLKFAEEDAERGFLTKGLWGWSRHPNFLCEQTFWVSITPVHTCALDTNLNQILISLFPVLATPKYTKLSLTEVTPLLPLIPCLFLCVLFFSSTIYTEKITKSKYPVGYGCYQERVAMFVPLLTPVWGVWTSLTGRREEVERRIWGEGKGKAKAE